MKYYSSWKMLASSLRRCVAEKNNWAMMLQCFPVWTFSWCFSVRQIDFALGGHGRRGGLTEKVDYLVPLMMAVLGESMEPC